ncbi:MAG: protein translocase subunit SecF, partial [Pirellulales bacterium]|nr:protein translocase subunit SecF [Pirellulales bacterium]
PSPGGSARRSARAELSLVAAAGHEVLPLVLTALAQDPAAEAPAAEAPAADAPVTTQPPAAESPAPTTPTESPATADAPASTDKAPAAPSTAAAEPGAALPPPLPPVSGRLEQLKRDFAGGSQVRVKLMRPVSYTSLLAKVHAVFGENVRVAIHSESPDFVEESAAKYDLWELFVALPAAALEAKLPELQAAVSAEPYFPSSTNIGGAVAAGLRQQAIVALIVSQLLLILYIWVRFDKVVFGLAAVIAVIHDVSITLGIVGLTYFLAPYLGFLLVDPFKISLTVLSAFLTLIGYSINDTIVVFDRIREVRGKSPNLTVQMLNQSINQTLSRTILTGMTTLTVLIILYIWGGPGIHGFAFVMLIGLIVGTFSSIFVASPMLLWLARAWQGAATSGQTSALPPRPSAQQRAAGAT